MSQKEHRNNRGSSGKNGGHRNGGCGNCGHHRGHAEELITGDTWKGQNLFAVKVLHSSEIEYVGVEGALDPETHVILETRYGKDLGLVLGRKGSDPALKPAEIRTLVRMAEDRDLEVYENNLAREKEALKICKEKVKSRNLDMKLVSAHYLAEESKVLFFFTAEARVDFRELVKDLVGVFRMRIELRQIGVRDEARVLGGLAVCGRDYCCHGLTDRLKPVSIRMAKEQNLSLNSMKISGPCGRLLCCLSYEYDFYKEEKKTLPSAGVRLQVQGKQVKVNDVNVVTRHLTVGSADWGIFDVSMEHVSKDEKTGEWILDPQALP